MSLRSCAVSSRPGGVYSSLDGHFGAPAAGRRTERDAAGGVDLRPGDRPPGNEMVRSLFDKFRLPRERQAERPRGDPVRAPVVGDPHGLDLVHEGGQVRQVAPETVELVGGAVDGNAAACADGATGRAVQCAEALRTARVQHRHSDDRRRGREQSRPSRGRRDEGREEQAKVHDVADHARREPGRGSRRGQDPDAGRELPHAEGP